MSSIRLDREPGEPSSPRANIVQIRDLLGQRFSQVRMTLAEKSPGRAFFSTGLPQIDGLLQGGLPKGAVTELVSAQAGGALALRRIIRVAGQNRQRVALVDGVDGFDPTALSNELLAGLLWVRCRDAAQALKATDLLLRDGNLPLVILDLHHNSAAPQAREKIPGTTWYRLQRIIEPTPTALLVMTPRATVSSAEARLSLANQFTLSSWEQREDELISRMKFVLQRSASSEVHEPAAEVG